MENTNVPQGEWFTNEWGSQRFHYEGWEIVIPEERPDSRRHAPYIICPFDDCQVDITDEGLMVFGESYGAPIVLGVVGTLDEGILLLRSLGRTEGNIVEVVNPIWVTDRLVQVPNKVHEWKAPKQRKAKAA